METSKHTNTNNGFALLLAIVIASVLLAIGLTMLAITVKQLTLSSVARESEIAFHAANAAMECVRYHRTENRLDDYTDRVTDPVAPIIDCFGVSSDDNSSFIFHDATPQFTNGFSYEFDWGTVGSERCSRIDLYVMQSEGSDYTVNFSAFSSALGSDGVKTCPEGSTCSAAIARGYNRACGDVDRGLATVEREVTAQY